MAITKNTCRGLDVPQTCKLYIKQGIRYILNSEKLSVRKSHIIIILQLSKCDCNFSKISNHVTATF